MRKNDLRNKTEKIMSMNKEKQDGFFDLLLENLVLENQLMHKDRICHGG